MLCEKCGNAEANVHITQNINGVRKEMHLCEHCAKQSGQMVSVDRMMDQMFSDFFTSMLPARARRTRFCAPALNEYAGCEDCLEDGQKYTAPPTKTPQDEIAELESQLKEAVQKEEYERAAVLRDKLRAKKQQNGSAQ